MYTVPKTISIFKEIHEETLKDFAKCECHICGKLFGLGKGAKLEEHVAVVHQGVKNQCEFCQRLFAGETSLNRHVKNIHEGAAKKYKCEDCGDMFTSTWNLKIHKYGKNNMRTKCTEKIEVLKHSCKICAKFYPSEFSLQKHVKSVHPDGIAKSCICDICDKTFKTWQELRDHLPEHDFKYSKDPDSVLTGEFHCSKCPRVFLVAETLEQHIAKSHSDKSFQCDVCQLTFIKLTKLQVHAKKVHPETEFDWSIDNLTRIQVDAMEIHKCIYCGKRFITDKRLNEHKCNGELVNWENVHKNLEYQLSKPTEHGEFECLVCNKSYSKKSRLRDHVSDMHSILSLQHIDPPVPQTLYKCEPCNLTYNSEHSFRSHVKKNHADVQQSHIIQM